MKIEEIAKEMTREEFLKKADGESHCPIYYNLKEICELCLDGKSGCHQCFEQATKDIKFKGEDKVKTYES